MQEWSGAAVKLLKGPLYESEDRKTWNILIRFRDNLEAYFRVIGLHVVTEEEDGYAYLEQVKDSVEKGMENEDEAAEELPRLIRKVPFSYTMSMLLVLLRQEYEKFASSMNESRYPILRKGEIMGLIRSFREEASDMTKFSDDADRMIRQLCQLTYLRTGEVLSSARISDDAEFEISPIIKSKIDVNFMREMLSRMNRTERKEDEE
ncbi:MAG: DUF4194 domain-containing protein [Bullifex sp.]|nr:DUF4194 domain-containing protein [Bullifex sp.]